MTPRPPVTAPYAGSPLLTPGRTIAVITTYNRASLLAGLLESIAREPVAPAAVVVIDNASEDETPALLEGLAGGLEGPRGHTVPLVVERLPRNTGGAGGFRRGMELALSERFDALVPREERWVWLMDDDVALIPGGLARLAARELRADVIHGARLNADGTPFFWRHVLDPATGVHWPMREPARSAPVAETNVACFEGALVSALTAETVGLPDARFFLGSDDTTYGFLASRAVRVVVCDEPLLRKMRAQASIDLRVRHLNDASDLSRRLTLRNRALMAQHLARVGAHSPARFALGTALTAAKEAVRLLAVEAPAAVREDGVRAAAARAARSAAAIARGLREARQVRSGRLDLGPLP
ncbi:glycosyltransferase [Falsarthrobacter nasiphocae]|uniref:GT2 family glycosyltransferase n=1 Tax=Falsarthrobacter nasiphocae TaxID=189863 RepID=A0AAE3YIU5_9MICC|nr:glycosyltransferase [Falsarthrobacter nasiphocae]MDR6892768.1 GT2 family glycosyltransferase [Falsarthrobacter nasiphocae]